MNYPIIIINLDRDVERLENAINQLNDFDNIVRYPAINGKELNLQDIDITPYTRYLIEYPNNRCSHQQINTPGGIGCYLSHCNVWNMYQDSPQGGILVFEDDLNVCKNFKSELTNILNNIPSDCDILSFGYLGLLEKCKMKESLTKSSSFFFGLQGYYISNQGMKKLLQCAFPIEVHLDAYVALAAKQGWINLYFTKKSLVHQCNVTSNITYNYCYKCLLPNMSMYGLISIGIVILFIIAIILLYKLRK